MSGTSGATLEQTRVILVEMPRMLREIIREVVANQADLEVVDEDDSDVAQFVIAKQSAGGTWNSGCRPPMSSLSIRQAQTAF